MQLHAAFEFDETAQPGWTPGRDMHYLVHILHVREMCGTAYMVPSSATACLLLVRETINLYDFSLSFC